MTDKTDPRTPLVVLDIEVHVDDRALLNEHRAALSPLKFSDGQTFDPAGGTAQEVADAVLTRDTRYFSYDGIAVRNTPTEHYPDTVTIRVHATITDPIGLEREAIELGRSSGFERDWEPGTLGVALWEVMIASNEMPSPDEYGIQLGETQSDVQYIDEDIEDIEATEAFRRGCDALFFEKLEGADAPAAQYNGDPIESGARYFAIVRTRNDEEDVWAIRRRDLATLLVDADALVSAGFEEDRPELVELYDLAGTDGPVRIARAQARIAEPAAA